MWKASLISCFLLHNHSSLLSGQEEINATAFASAIEWWEQQACKEESEIKGTAAPWTSIVI